MDDNKHSREVLISLRKRYSKDEAVAILFKKLSNAETELGIVKSERDEALHKLKCIEKEEKQVKTLKKDVRERIDASKKLKAKVKKLERENEYLIKKGENATKKLEERVEELELENEDLIGKLY